jgi:hypothetical protein
LVFGLILASELGPLEGTSLSMFGRTTHSPL